MPIDLTCSCGKRLRVANEFAGRQGQCPICGQLLEIPERDDAGVGSADPSPLEVAQVVTARPDSAKSSEQDGPKFALTPLPSEPPERLSEGLEISRPAYKLFSSSAIGTVAFLTGPVGALLMLSLNYWRLGKRPAAGITVVVCLLVVAALMVMSFALPDSSIGWFIALPLFLAVWGAARALQGSAYETHLEHGGKPASGWAAAGFGLLGLLLYFGVLLGIAGMFDYYNNFGEKIEFGKGEEIYYANGATEAEARALGKLLREIAYFNDQGAKSVRVSLDGNRLVISFVVMERALTDLEIQKEFRWIGTQASLRAFDGRPVEVQLCDQHFKVKKKL